MSRSSLVLAVSITLTLAAGLTQAGPNQKKQERAAREALQASPPCQALAAEYAKKRAKFSAAVGDMAGEVARDLAGIQQRYRDTCGELPKKMREDLSQEVRAAERAGMRAERKEAREAEREARQDARSGAKEAEREARDDARDLRKDLREAERGARGLAEDGTRGLRQAGREIAGTPGGAASAAAGATAAGTAAAAATPAPEFKRGADAARCTRLLTDLRASDARFKACGKDKECRQREKSGFVQGQAAYAGRCGDLPKDLKKIG